MKKYRLVTRPCRYVLKWKINSNTRRKLLFLQLYLAESSQGSLTYVCNPAICVPATRTKHSLLNDDLRSRSCRHVFPASSFRQLRPIIMLLIRVSHSWTLSPYPYHTVSLSCKPTYTVSPRSTLFYRIVSQIISITSFHQWRTVPRTPTGLASRWCHFQFLTLVLVFTRATLC